MKASRATCFIFILGLPAFTFGSLSSSVDVTLQEYEMDCAQNTGTNSTLIEQAREQRKIPITGEMDDFAICMLKKFNVIREDGKVNLYSHTYTIFSDSVYLHRKSDTCKQLKGQSIGETARKIMNCFMQENELMLALTSWKNKKTTVK